MSHSIIACNIFEAPWEKLYIYLQFRWLIGGIWIDKSAEFWFNTITSYDYAIINNVYADYGGGGLTSQLFRVVDMRDSIEDYKDDMETYFECELSYDEPPKNYSAMEATYRYMSKYFHGWDEMDYEKWNRCFGPFDDIKSLNSNDKIPPLVFFKLLKQMKDAENALDEEDREKIWSAETKYPGKMNDMVIKCKQWALFALVEMERYYMTVC